MAGLADDWEENRQTCVDVLCAYLRLPYKPDPGQAAEEPQRLAFQAFREVRHTVIWVITAHLKDGAEPSWRGLHFNFAGVVFDGGDFRGAEFSSGEVGFVGAEFSGGEVFFGLAKFSGGTVGFGGAEFSGGTVDFGGAQFSGGNVGFGGTEYEPLPGIKVQLGHAEFSSCTVDFSGAADWSSPPTFPWTDAPPPGVKLPKKEDQSQA